MEIYKHGDEQYPKYAASYKNQTVTGPDYVLYFTKAVGPEVEDSLYWDGVGWTTTISLSANIGSASGKSIIANVPLGAYTIPDNVSYLAWAVHDTFGGERITFIDVAPDEYSLWCVPDSAAIPSYNIFIVVGLLFGISMFIARKHIKRK